ncbi:MAG: TolC family protein [Bacteriovoracaceae bacterium]|nr:TolC family protein [Bacteriovoracaceae bacterium]
MKFYLLLSLAIVLSGTALAFERPIDHLLGPNPTPKALTKPQVGKEVSLTLQEAIKMATDYSEELQLQRYSERKAHYKHTEARAAHLPKIDLSGNWIKYTQRGNKTANPAPYAMNYGLEIKQTLFAFGRIQRFIEAADYAHQAQEYVTTATYHNIVYQTKAAYFTVLMAQQTVDINQASLTNAQKTRKLLEERFNNGRPGQSDSIKTQADIASRIPALKNAQIQLRLAVRNLKDLLGLDEATKINLTTALPSEFSAIDFNQMEEKSLQAPNLKALEKTITSLEHNVKADRPNFLPTFALVANWNRAGGGDKRFPKEESYKTTSSILINASINLFSGGSEYGNYRQAVMDKIGAQLKLKQAQREAEFGLRNAFTNYESLQDNLKANREAIRLAEKSFKLIQKLYRSGQAILSDLNDAERSLTTLRLQEIQTIYNINLALANIELLTAPNQL